MSLETEVLRFFTDYGEAFRDGVRLAEFYGDCAMASTPAFVGCLNGEAEVRAALVSVAKEQVRTGMRALVPQKVDVTSVDSIHCWAHVYWGAKFENSQDQLIEFDISYLIRRNSDRLIILLYITHQDDQKMRQELGLT